MANHFYGSAVSEHYEKKPKDFKPVDWIMVALLSIICIAAVASGFMRRWGLMVVFIGVAACMLHVLLRVMFKAKNKVTIVFTVLGILAIIAGILLEADKWDVLPCYFVFVYMIVAFSVGIICVGIKRSTSRKMKEYSLSVEATCEQVEVKKINLFKSDDLSPMYNAPINSNTIYRPAFHYFVDGKEYYTRSEVYYGDLNEGFREGDKITLRVDPNDPGKVLPAKVDGTVGNMAAVMGVFWLVAGIVGIVVLILMLNGTIVF